MKTAQFAGQYHPFGGLPPIETGETLQACANCWGHELNAWEGNALTDTEKFNAIEWRTTCAALNQRCRHQAMSSLHFTMLYSQAIEKQLQTLPPKFAFDAIEIARELDYETSSEVTELVDSVTENALCKHGVAWRYCMSECNSACGQARPAK